MDPDESQVQLLPNHSPDQFAKRLTPGGEAVLTQIKALIY